MIYVLLIAMSCAIFFLMRLLHMKKQLKSITTQLQHYNKRKTNMKLDVSLSNKHMEALAVELNYLIAGRAEADANTHRVEQELKEVIASMSHDLRTPLTSIIGYMQLIERQDVSNEKKGEYLAVAQKRAIHLQKLINDFFALSIVESEDYPLQLENFKLNTLVQELLLEYYDPFQALTKQPTIDIKNEALRITGDKIACKRVIENLLLNALQHASGDISIHLGRQGKMAVLKVSNQVIQSDKLDVNKLFDRFYTAEESRSEYRGIGLTIVHHLMKRMNGDALAVLKEGELTIICRWKLANKI